TFDPERRAVERRVYGRGRVERLAKADRDRRDPRLRVRDIGQTMDERGREGRRWRSCQKASRCWRRGACWDWRRGYSRRRSRGQPATRGRCGGRQSVQIELHDRAGCLLRVPDVTVGPSGDVLFIVDGTGVQDLPLDPRRTAARWVWGHFPNQIVLRE